MSDPLDAVALVWHDLTCPEGVDCRDRDLHAMGGGATLDIVRHVVARTTVLTPEMRAQALREAADAMEKDPGITKGRITQGSYGFFVEWLRDEALLWLAGEAPEQIATFEQAVKEEHP